MRSADVGKELANNDTGDDSDEHAKVKRLEKTLRTADLTQEFAPSVHPAASLNLAGSLAFHNGVFCDVSGIDGDAEPGSGRNLDDSIIVGAQSGGRASVR